MLIIKNAFLSDKTHPKQFNFKNKFNNPQILSIPNTYLNLSDEKVAKKVDKFPEI